MNREEKLIREYIRRKIGKTLKEHKEKEKQILKEELRLRKVIRELLKEGDISDMHPHRSTGINVLEDVLKKMITTLRTDYKRMTTNKNQRDSFRAHMISAIKGALAPSLVNDTYLQGTEVMLAEPTPAIGPEAAGIPTDEPEEGGDLDDLDIQLEEVDIDIEDEDEEDKKIPVEDDDHPDEKEEFGSELDGLDETGRNMAFTTFKKVSQYILDAYDMLANVEDKKIFVDYLITNMKLYFDKFEQEIQKDVEEPSTQQYDSMQK
tara:strand:- start:1303 stop:2091 length:789 start_codon:yes stop_codon:yes gene_type:complete